MRLTLCLIPIVAGIALAQDDATQENSTQDNTTQETAPKAEPRPPVAVGGEALFELETRTATLDDGSTGDMFIAGPMRINSPLPEGYPRPTPAGAMEVKHYPSIRRAQLTVEASPRWGMNMAFFPLFRHIKDRDIAMTAPVVAEVPAMAQRAQQEGQAGDADASRTGEMTVSFLYRTGDMGELGQAEENVRVVDAEPVTVLALGIRGSMDNDRIEREVGTLYAWLDAQGQTNPGPDGEKLQGRWHAHGAPRILGYNGPDVRRGDQWWEVQVPVAWTAAVGE